MARESLVDAYKDNEIWDQFTDRAIRRRGVKFKHNGHAFRLLQTDTGRFMLQTWAENNARRYCWATIQTEEKLLADCTLQATYFVSAYHWKPGFVGTGIPDFETALKVAAEAIYIDRSE